jgi:hypothetical protein
VAQRALARSLALLTAERIFHFNKQVIDIFLGVKKLSAHATRSKEAKNLKCL